jgi:non-homologous end joining protein Ku
MDDEPEEIEFDFDKYKDMYQNNAVELIESNIDDEEDEYEES